MNPSTPVLSHHPRVRKRLCSWGCGFLAVVFSASVLAQAPSPQLALRPVNLKLLLLAGSGTEPSFLGMQNFLNQIGISHDDVILAPPGKPAVTLPPLNDSSKGFYQGIILATGELASCNAAGACTSALSAEGWAALDTYAASFGIRTLSYYTYPNPRYGLTPLGTVDTTAKPTNLVFSPLAAPFFPYLKLTNPIQVTNSWVYTAVPVAAAGEQTIPLIAMNGAVVAAMHTAVDGRQSLALTFDNSPYLLHSLALNYGLISWVTKGVFIGSRHIYLTPQVDDVFIGNDLYDATTAGCKPTGFLVDPTVDLSTNCPVAQMDGTDLAALATWQDKIQANAQTSRFKTTLAYNGTGTDDGEGAVDLTNDLVAAAKTLASKFFWISHTYNHFNLDCYDAVLNSGICKAATPAQSGLEIDSNVQTAKTIGLTIDAQSMVTPEISGLNNPDFIHTAVQRGIKYLIVDSSTLTANPPPPYAGVLNAVDNSVIEVPRRPTSIFYNTSSPNRGAPGSLVDEYNYFYGPQGLFRIGGIGGAPFFTTNQTYTQIIGHESDSLLLEMLKYSPYPSMYHQSNLVQYNTGVSLFTDVMDATLNKFTKMSNLPVISLTQSELGQLIQQRMDYNASGVQATWMPGTPATITITTLKPAIVPITGFCKTNCESYGGQVIANVQVFNQPVTVSGQ